MLHRLFAALVFTLLAGSFATAADGFKPIFDGKTLDGWQAPDMSFWSVEDGAITARSTEDHPCKHNQFLVWQQGEVDDFELKLRFRIIGSEQANSGIQFRSFVEPDGHVAGYQADIDRSGKWLGALYDEKGRGPLAKRGQHTTIAVNGERTENTAADADALLANVNLDDWNDYHLIARGGQIVLKINGKTTAEVIDDESAHRDLVGVLALQLHSGPPMTVQFKDIQLKRLPLSGDRKKIVMIAGKPSHPAGEHEFNAGVKLLKHCLDPNPNVIVANYHDNGWPHDPTAFDNADGVIFYMDGWRVHAVNGHFEEVDALAERGVGLMFMHYAVHTDPGEKGDYFKKWIGGFYETDYSTNPHWKADLDLTRPHPITRGVGDPSIVDEWYFNIRFREGMKDITAIAQATPTDENMVISRRGTRFWNEYADRAMNKPNVLMWAVERPDGGRGLGFTGGHWHKNWADPDQRKLVLNAILWVAGAPVPESGVESDVTEELMKANLDPKPKRNKRRN